MTTNSAVNRNPSCIFNCDFTNPINLSKNPQYGAFVKFKCQSTPNFPSKFSFSFAVKFDPWSDTILSGQPLLETNLQKLHPPLDLSPHPEQLLCSQHTYTTPPTSYTFSHTHQNTYSSQISDRTNQHP